MSECGFSLLKAQMVEDITFPLLMRLQQSFLVMVLRRSLMCATLSYVFKVVICDGLANFILPMPLSTMSFYSQGVKRDGIQKFLLVLVPVVVVLEQSHSCYIMPTAFIFVQSTSSLLIYFVVEGCFSSLDVMHLLA